MKLFYKLFAKTYGNFTNLKFLPSEFVPAGPAWEEYMRFVFLNYLKT